MENDSSITFAMFDMFSWQHFIQGKQWHRGCMDPRRISRERIILDYKLVFENLFFRPLNKTNGSRRTFLRIPDMKLWLYPLRMSSMSWLLPQSFMYVFKLYSIHFEWHDWIISALWTTPKNVDAKQLPGQYLQWSLFEICLNFGTRSCQMCHQ